MLPDAIDPRLSDSQTQPPSQPHAALPSRNFDEADYDSEDDGNEGSEKRRKLNLWKCKQCRDARKKCLPEGRVWPQKCERCLQHRPNELECSEPQLNTRKRGPNLDRSKTTTRSKTSRSTPDIQEPRDGVKKDESPPITPMVFGRPVRQPVVPKNIKKELPETPKEFLESRPPPPANDEQFPASAYLPLGEAEFRVLVLAPGYKGERPVFSFVTESITRPMEYEAISYLWGGGNVKQQEMKDVELLDPNGRFFLRPTKNTLYSALQHLRHPTDARRFWVDALCINHSNRNEKSQQTAMKRYIFHNATNLCFWLGEDPTSKAALAFVPKILDLTRVEKLVDDSAVDGWVAFVGLLQNTVFSRLWLLQEVAVARNVTLHCGQPAIHYGDLVDAVAIFVSYRSKLSTLFHHKKKNCKELADRRMTVAERFIDISTNALRVSNSGKVQRLLTLEGLVSQLSDLSSGNPRDRIFAVLALAKDGPGLMNKTLVEYPPQTREEGAFRIDYEKSILEVYQDFVIHAIERSRSLDIICRHWASSVSEREVMLPTWVRPLHSYLQPSIDSNLSERTSADSLVGLPDRNFYNAARGTVANYELNPLYCHLEKSFDTAESFNNNDYFHKAKALRVSGHRLNTIFKIGPRASEGIILYEWLELGGCTTGTVPEDFWRTLVADRGPDGSNAPSWYHRAFEYCLHHLTSGGDINTNRLIAESEAESPLVVQFLQRVQSVIWNRKFFVSKNGWMGLAPMAAELGDLICVLFGCSVPVVLRPFEGHFRFVGECYVHGMMNGDAIETALAGGNREEKFELR